MRRIIARAATAAGGRAVAARGDWTIIRAGDRMTTRALRPLHALGVYADLRMLAIVGMGFASGLPLLLTTATLSYWLARVGVDKTSIGLFALVGLPYSLKFAWAPLLDRMELPWLGRRLGQRRSWALVTQLGLVASILAMGATDPAAAPLVTAATALAVAFFSASQDVAIDAYRIEVLREHEQGAGAAATQAGYRVGLLAAGAGAIALADFVAWPIVFAALAACVGVGMATVLLAPEPAVAPPRERSLARAFVEPMRDFARRPQWIAILVFALLYKFGDAISGVMANPFFVELGFSGVEIASVTKVLGVFAGGALVARLGIPRSLLVGGLLQAVTNLLYAAQAQVGHSVGMLALSVGADSFTGGLGSAAFVAYLSSLCSPGLSGTQFALLTSLMAVGRTVLSSGGGWLADQVDWVTFFVLTTALAAPGLALLGWLGRAGAAKPIEPPAAAARR
jgi:PAT family beta-lactamase induction signal transducer AmpG